MKDNVRRTTALVLALALVAGMAGTAVASLSDVAGTRFQSAVDYLTGLGVLVGYPDGTFRPDATITRAESVKIIIVMRYGDAAAADLLRGSEPFGDVPGDHWASGFITLARNSGIVAGFPDGTFKPGDLVTYAQFAKMLVEAAGLSPLPGVDWPINYVAVAQGAGMADNVPGFGANDSASRGDCAIMAAHTVRNVTNPATGRTLAESVFSGSGGVASLTIDPQQKYAAAGESVVFTVTARDSEGNPVAATPTYSTSAPSHSAVSTAGLFVASAPGTYRVTATVDGREATAVVSVYGPAAGLRAAPAATSVIANGAAKVSIAVEVLDAAGTLVAGDNTTVVGVQYDLDGNNGAVSLPAVVTAAVSGGRASFEFTAGNAADRTDAIKFVHWVEGAEGTLASSRAEILTVSQVAAAVSLTAFPSQITSNSVTSTTVTAKVLDQTGVVVESGVFTLSLQISGPGAFTAAGDAAPRSLATMLGEATQTVYSVQGYSGTIRVSATCEGLAPASVEISSQLAGLPAALGVEIADSSLKSGSSTDLAKLRVFLVDDEGRPTTSKADLDLEIVLDDGKYLWTKGLAVKDSPTALVIPAGSTTSPDIVLYNHPFEDGAIAGVHRLKARDTAREFTAPSFEIEVTPGAAEKIVVTPSGPDPILLPIDDPSLIVAVQVQDEAGNNVPHSGMEITCTLAASTAVGLVSVNGTKLATGIQVKVQTDAGGAASFAVAAQRYVDDSFQLQFTGMPGWPAAYASEIRVADQVPRSIAIAFRNGPDSSAPQVGSIAADASEYVYAHIQVRDENEADFLGFQRLMVVLSNDGVNVKPVEAADIVVGSSPDIEQQNPPEDLHLKTMMVTTDATGLAVFSLQGDRAGSFVLTAKAIQVIPVVTYTRPFKTVAGSDLAGYAIETAGGAPVDGMMLQANTPLALRLCAMDNGGNPLVVQTDHFVGVQGRAHGHADEICATTPAAGWEIRLTADGTSVSEVKIGPGSIYAYVYYVQNEAGEAIIWVQD